MDGIASDPEVSVCLCVTQSLVDNNISCKSNMIRERAKRRNSDGSFGLRKYGSDVISEPDVLNKYHTICIFEWRQSDGYSRAYDKHVDKM